MIPSPRSSRRSSTSRRLLLSWPTADSIKLSDDWNGADFIAQHFNTDSFLKIQLKGRWLLNKKYCGKDIWICFREDDAIYLYPHDEVMDRVLNETKFMKGSESWEVSGGYNRGSLSKELREIMEQYRLE